jgi:hypothetical protein
MLNLGPLGQMWGTHTYTILTLGFPIADESQQEAVIQVLSKATSEIIGAYPWLAGQVVNETAKEDEGKGSGVYRVVEYKPHEQGTKFLHVKDCRALCPSYADIVKARAPLSKLDGRILSPAYGFPNMYPNSVVEPVLIMQANLITGGLLLTICAQHNVMDANGNAMFIRQFASLCRGQRLSEEQVRIGNSDRETIIPPLKPGQEALPLEIFRLPSMLSLANADPAAANWPPANSGTGWKCFRFTAANVAALKAEASKECSSEKEAQYISSNDAVSTFTWTRIVAARSRRLPKGGNTQLIRGVNARTRLDSPISDWYMGHVILCSLTTVPVENAINDSLSSTTLKVRRSLLDVNDHQIRSFFELLKTEKDRTTINYGAKMDSEADIMITSFAGLGLYDADFGELLGKPDFVRRPTLPAGTAPCYIMPVTREGDIDIIFVISQEEFEILQADAKWTEFTEVIG